MCLLQRWGLLMFFGSLFVSCAMTDQPHVHSQSYLGHVESGAPFFNFVPLSTREHWQIVGTDACARQLQSFLASQPEYHDPRSDNGAAVAASVELVGVRSEVQPWYDTDHHDVHLRVERILQLHPAQAEFVRSAER